MEFRIIRSSQFSDEKPRNVKGIYLKDDNWYIKINALEELIDFYNQYGDLIISKICDIDEKLKELKEEIKKLRR